LTLEQTAQTIGRSVGDTCRIRTSFCVVASGKRTPAQPKTALRYRTKVTLKQETTVLDKVLHDEHLGGVVMVVK
jgi:hypothetical protein